MTTREGYTQVSAERTTDASGNVVVDGTIWFQPVDADGQPKTFTPFPQGVAMKQPVNAKVTNGVFSLWLADTSTTTPEVWFAVTIKDNQSGNVLLGPGYLIQPTRAAWACDQFAPQSSRKD